MISYSEINLNTSLFSDTYILPHIIYRVNNNMKKSFFLRFEIKKRVSDDTLFSCKLLINTDVVNNKLGFVGFLVELCEHIGIGNAKIDNNIFFNLRNAVAEG